MDKTKKEIIDLHSKHKGKLTVLSTVKIDSKEVLSQVYTPGVGTVCLEIKENPERIKDLTIAGKMVAIISDGTAVLGFGDIGPRAALPVMEGKAAIFKEFANIDAFPICIDEKNTEELIKTIKNISINFAAINLEDISAPRCFEIEKRLIEELDIPVMHDDQHGTAIVTLAALKGAVNLTNKKKLNIVISGAGAAGMAILKLLVVSDLDINEIRVLDSKGLVSNDRSDLNKYKEEIANLTKQNKHKSIEEAIRDTDIFIGVSVANLLNSQLINSMRSEPIIFAMSNPIPEIMPEEAIKCGASIVATGRSDFANQINNALAYPGVFKGLLASGIKKVDDAIKLKAADAIYNYHKKNLTTESILPSILDKNVPEIIARTILN